MTRERTSSSRKVCGYRAAVPHGDDVPAYKRSVSAEIVSRVDLIESLHCIRPQRCLFSSLPDSSYKYAFKLLKQREAASAVYSELYESGILARRPSELSRKTHVLKHHVIDAQYGGIVLGISEFAELRDDIIRQMCCCIAYERGHDICHFIKLLFKGHMHLLFRSSLLHHSAVIKRVKVA